MKIITAYEKYLLRIEKNGTNDNVATNKGTFVELYNSSALRYEAYILEKKNEDDIRQIAPLLVTSNRVLGEKENDYYVFELPKDLFDFSSLQVRAKKDNCYADMEILTEIKNQNKQFYMSDEFTSPSFEYREAIFNLSDNKVKIYTDGTFSLPYMVMDYYKHPVKARLVDPEDPESDFDETIDLGLGEDVIDRILALAAGEFDFRTDNPRGQLNIQRAMTKI